MTEPNTTETRTIVLAKAVKLGVGYYKLVACIWLNEGTVADFRNAEVFAKTEGYRVFSFATDEPKPLERAKCAVVPKDMPAYQIPYSVLDYADSLRPEPKENEGLVEFMERAEFERAVFFA